MPKLSFGSAPITLGVNADFTKLYMIQLEEGQPPIMWAHMPWSDFTNQEPGWYPAKACEECSGHHGNLETYVATCSTPGESELVYCAQCLIDGIKATVAYQDPTVAWLWKES